ncbi:MAG: DUF1036 domain-containing protein [Aeromonadales bacterium]|nr:DUF1036 domain-containing protein [Aeromonadales bacterium]
MKKLLALCALTLASTCMSANALEVTIDNKTKATVVMAFSYLDSKTNDWVVDGWYNVEPEQKALVNLDSKNDIYYLYSEFSNGKKLEGGKGSVVLKVKNRNFFYKQTKPTDDLDRKATFLRARSNNGKSLIKIN